MKEFREEFLKEYAVMKFWRETQEKNLRDLEKIPEGKIP